MDLEITNSSLLNINASLERLKSLQKIEIRDLRRRLRESRTHIPLSATLSIPDEGASDAGDSELGVGEDEVGEEMSWEQVLSEDKRFEGVVMSLERMLRRGREAIQFVPVLEEGGRVLDVQQMDDYQGT